MYAIIEDSGTQIRVAEGDIVDIDLRDVGSKSKKIKFDRVLLVDDGRGEDPAIGTPYVDGAAVTADVLGEVRADKIDVVKYKRRKGYHNKQGHRQAFLRVKIDEISAPGRRAPKKKASEDASK